MSLTLLLSPSSAYKMENLCIFSSFRFSMPHVSHVLHGLKLKNHTQKESEKIQMSSRYDHQRVHLQKPISLPIICRLSIKDVEPNNHYRRRIQKLDVPSSPRVSCIGQVKRDNRITALPANVAALAPTANHHKQKLKKPRSSGTLFLSTTDGGGGARGGVSRSCRTSKEEIIVNNSRMIKLTNSGYQDRVKELNIGELDPPLPVVKRVIPPPGVGRDEVNLWRRRCLRAAELKSLQIEQKHLPNNNFEPPPTV